MFSRTKEEKKLRAVCGPNSSVRAKLNIVDRVEIVFTTLIDGIPYAVSTPMGVDNLAEVLEGMHKDMAGLITKY
tara:strand:- start:28146 stop:28367 length:222 start_codon:yes stop_codon:yes gene_type:complete